MVSFGCIIILCSPLNTSHSSLVFRSVANPIRALYDELIMGDISDHFSKRDFVCRCGKCQNEFKVSMTLVGVLEQIRMHFNKRLEVVVGHHCEEENARIGGVKKSYHVLGKAARITVMDTPSEEVFRYVERIPQVQGLALDPVKKQVYLDVRDRAPHRWIIEGEREHELTPEVRERFKLGEPQEMLAPF